MELSINAVDAASAIRRETYDARGAMEPAGGVGVLRRSEGAAPTGDAIVDTAHDNVGAAHAFMKEVLGRDSIDGNGGTIRTVVNWGRNFSNAAWDGENLLFGNGDGVRFSPLGQAVDVVAHEAFHGVVQHTAGLVYRNQPGALNESFGDVFGELVDQWTTNREGFGTVDAAKAADWLVGEDVFTPGTAGDALRSLKAPGTAYGRDPQPAHMSKYNPTSDDNGGVHINSGIPNKAAYEVGTRIGGEKLAKVWYLALTDYLKPRSSFADAANATLAAARKLYGEGAESQAVLDAWKSVGVLTDTPAGDQPAQAEQPGQADIAAATDADSAHAHGEDAAHGIVPTWLADGVVDATEAAALGVSK